MSVVKTEVPAGFVPVYTRPKSLSEARFTYCPGCHHGIITRLVAEAIDELGIQERTVGIAPVGCAVFLYEFFRCDFAQAAHGRACAVATGIKRANPDLIVFHLSGRRRPCRHRHCRDRPCGQPRGEHHRDLRE
jgi:pyruvate/2-oxoacid:ferredoxin oxidoreductase beta subunit